LEGSPSSGPFSILLPLTCHSLLACAQKTVLPPDLSVFQLKDLSNPVISQNSFHARIVIREAKLPFILHHFWAGIGC
jgi:hypothetical protein